RRKPIGAKLGTGLALFPLLLTAGWEKVPEGRMRAGAPSAPVSQQSRCCPTARFARGPHPALRATFSHAARGRRGKLQFAALNLAPMPLTPHCFAMGPSLSPLRGREVYGRCLAGIWRAKDCVNPIAAFAGMTDK